MATHRKGILGAGAMMVIAGAMALAQNGPPAARVRLDAARIESVEPLRRVTGELAPTRRSRVASERDGLVIEMLVEAGDVVTEGQVVARLDDASATIELNRAEADLRAAKGLESARKSELLRARRDLERTRQMKEGDAAFSSELEDRETDFAGAEARLEEASAEVSASEAVVADARRMLGETVITAPYAGQVVSKVSEIGQWVREGDAVVEIIERSPIDAWLDVPEQYLPAIRAGSATTVQIMATAIGLSTEGTVEAILAQGDALGRKFPVRVRLANEDGALLPGMSIVGIVPTGGSEPALTVHKDGVLRNDAGSYVYFDAGGVAAIAPVEIDFAVGDRFAVRSPMLRDGSMVVVEGNERLYPGAALAPIPDSAGAPSGRAGSGD